MTKSHKLSNGGVVIVTSPSESKERGLNLGLKERYTYLLANEVRDCPTTRKNDDMCTKGASRRNLILAPLWCFH